HRNHPTRKSSEITEKAFAVLCCEHADNQYQWPRHAFFQIGERCRDCPAAVRIMSAVEPEFAANRSKLDEAALTQPVQALGPVALGHAGIVGGRWNRKPTDCAQRGDGETCILELVPAVELRRWQIEQPTFILVYKATAFLGCRPIFAGDLQRRAEPRSLPLEHGHASTRC